MNIEEVDVVDVVLKRDSLAAARAAGEVHGLSMYAGRLYRVVRDILCVCDSCVEVVKVLAE